MTVTRYDLIEEYDSSRLMTDPSKVPFSKGGKPLHHVFIIYLSIVGLSNITLRKVGLIQVAYFIQMILNHKGHQIGKHIQQNDRIH